MSEETNNTRPWLPWAVALSVIVSISLGIKFMDWPNIFVTPWPLVNGVFTIQAIDAFEKITPLEAAPFSDQLRILAAILLLFIVGPACWIWGEIRSQKEHIKLKSFIWYVGVILVGMGLFSTIYGTTTRLISFQDDSVQNNNKLIRLSKTADELESDLRKMARKAYELYYLPADRGGGGQSFLAFEDSTGVKRPIRLSDLNAHLQSDYIFVLKEVQSDSSITIYGISDISGVDPDFKNADGRQGLLQVAINVHPEDGFSNINNKESNVPFR
ncbi:hypothetical protein LX73_1770 [Fodinibius salinus]|uniref:Uncharacterized protein n=1 Tax=Fodinibius salinus TaxID=860790 RepID=A0A5D3YMV4_9BACT|nr:hypothetical protein [Fodinibius salinus]TYP94047.1 hypothetical protein LX73_1770 [Fodinibius salinus]